MEQINGDFYGKDIISVAQFSPEDVTQVFMQAEAMRMAVEKGKAMAMQTGRIMTNLFYEPSTRTSSSFSAAMQRLGGGVIQINDVQYSSVSKGENLPDTVRTLAELCDVIVLRHPEKGSAEVAAEATEIPIINGGDGIGEHPTQALLDLFTIKSEQGTLEDRTVTMVGDLKHGRTVHSLARMLMPYGAKLQFVSPDSLRMPTAQVEECREAGIEVVETSNLDEVLGETDVLYVTRVQKERFKNKKAYQKVKGSYRVNPEVMARAPGTMTLMHPLPRNKEIAASVDADPRAAYFRQVKNGMYVRMALLNLVLANHH
jgi:aspartate carbamoyltransferase